MNTYFFILKDTEFDNLNNFLSPTKGLKIGANVARGLENLAFYVVIGFGWLR